VPAYAATIHKSQGGFLVELIEESREVFQVWVDFLEWP
jgi:hypothetical protein